MLGGDEHAVAEAEAREIRMRGLVLVVVHLVDDEQDRRLGLAELLRQRLVDGRQTVLGIDDEKDQVRGLHRDVRLDGDLLVEAVVKRRADAAGVDQSAGMCGQRAGRGDAVPGDARLVVDDGDFPAGKAVEEGGLPDVRAADDGDGGHDFEILNFKL